MSETVEARKKELQILINKLSRKISDKKGKYSGEEKQVFTDQIIEAKKELKALDDKEVKAVPNSSSNIVANHRQPEKFHLTNNKFYF